jgi:hypothetical protein
MDDGTAFHLIGQTVSLIIDGRREDDVFVKGNNISTSSPTTLDLVLRTPVGEPLRRRVVRIDKVELAP